ncbi:MAG TPA: hypothetical protein VJV79_21760 [Polyangiaceae bacterium]|nr:hypothetical protein [Polyangiaceae bacterium]
MSKSATLESSSPSTTRPRRVRKPRPVKVDPTESSAFTASAKASAGFPTKPLLVGVGIGAALAFTAVALGSRPARSTRFSSTPTTVAGAFAKTAALLLARVVARKALAAAANQGARKLASAWPL